MCGILHGFLVESWQVRDSSWLFATTSCLFLTDFFFPQELGSLLKNHQKANKKTSRSCWDASKKHQDMSRSVTNCQFFSPKESWTFPIDQEYWRSAKKLSKKSPRSHQKLSRTQLKGQLLDGQPEIRRIIRRNYYQELEKKQENYKRRIKFKWRICLKQHAGNFTSLKLSFLLHSKRWACMSCKDGLNYCTVFIKMHQNPVLDISWKWKHFWVNC